ncbi:MAG: hypothetical protein ABGZ17_31390, partial [Planctomycetaceae bacterium]
ALEEATGRVITPGVDDEQFVELGYDRESSSLTFRNFDIYFGVDTHSSLNLDLADLGISGAGNLIDVNAQAQAVVGVGLQLDLNFDIDVTDPVRPVPYLLGDSKFTVRASIEVPDVDFDASLGPVGVAVRDGIIRLEQQSTANSPEFTDTASVAIVDGKSVLTLSQGTWPEGAADAALVVNNVAYAVASRDSDSTITLRTGDVPATTAEAQTISVTMRAPATLTLGVAGEAADRQDLSSSVLLDPANIDGQFKIDLPVLKPDLTRLDLDPNKENLTATVDLNNLTNLQLTSVPDFSQAFNSVDLSTDLFSTVEGWNAFFDLLERAVDGQVFGNSVPLIGNQLQDAARFITDLRTKVTDNLEQAGEKSVEFVQQRLFEALGPGGLNWLKDIAGPNSLNPDTIVDIHDVRVLAGSPGSMTDVTTDLSKIDPQVDSVQFDVSLGRPMTVSQVPIDIDLGIDGLELDVEGGVALSTAFSFDVGFGVSRTDGVYLDVGGTDDLSFEFAASLPGLASQGQIAFLQLDVQDARTNFGGQYTLQLDDPSGDGRLTMGELASGNFAG